MKKFLRRAYIALYLICIIAAILFVVGYRAFKGEAATQDAVIVIDTKQDYSEVRNTIHGLIDGGTKRTAFDIYAKRIELQSRIKAGHYTVKTGMSVIDIARMLALGKQTPVHIVISNARTMPQLADIISQQIAADSTTLIGTLYDKKLRQELGFVCDSLISMVIPNTYEVYWTISPEQLLRRLKRESDAFWNEERTAKLKQIGLSRHEAMTLASIVYEETKLESDMPRIAGVYMNRLQRKMPLQADPTVKYALQRFDLKRILKEHTRHRSPYNTYLNRGLPPSPICIPSIAAIDAVLNYEKHKYIYFCASPALDGTHAFARTLKEHNINAQRYHAELNRRKIK